MSKKAKWLEARVESIDVISPTKLIFKAQISNDQTFDFLPGQFVTMDLPIGDKRRQRWRSYSIANLPNPQNTIEFGIGRMEDGSASEYFFENLVIGDHIKFKGPEGAFVLPENLDRPIVMIATGTGVVPFVSMIRKIAQEKRHIDHLHLIYGCRYEGDLLYRAELEEYAATIENFELDIVLSRDQSWTGTKGHVHQVYIERYKEKSKEHLYLLCGWTAMIDEAMIHLFQRVEHPQQQIKYELYG